MLGDAMSRNAMLREELEGLAPGECSTACLSSCRWPPRHRCWWMRIELFTFTQYIQIVPFNLRRPGGHLRHVAGCEDVAAGKNAAAPRREVGDQGPFVPNDCG